MNSKSTSTTHWSFWIITTFMLIWNVMGCINFFVQMNPEMVASYRDNEQAIISGRPVWATIAFAIAVFGGALGCVLLMIKKHVAFYIFIASLLGVIVTTAHTLNIGIKFGIGEIIGIILMPTLLAVFLIWYSKLAERKGWIS
ncbi:MAG: hypothetical protein QNL62_10035 [Gammaproteobacteria bacterium]|nr:hypothetical protein [Gammaproteobacteria bacterium]